MQYGSIFVSILATVITKICWLKVEQSLPVNQFVFGATSSDRNLPHRLCRRQQGYGDTFFIDEVVINKDGKQRYL
jgi:hypothetical protein